MAVTHRLTDTQTHPHPNPSPQTLWVLASSSSSFTTLSLSHHPSLPPLSPNHPLDLHPSPRHVLSRELPLKYVDAPPRSSRTDAARVLNFKMTPRARVSLANAARRGVLYRILLYLYYEIARGEKISIGQPEAVVKRHCFRYL